MYYTAVKFYFVNIVLLASIYDYSLYQIHLLTCRKRCIYIIFFKYYTCYRRMAENGFAPPPREFCRHILSCRELKAESFKRCLHSVLRGVSLYEPVTYVTLSN